MKWASAPGSVSSRWHLTARCPFERHQAEESPEAHGSQPARFSQAVHISPQICIQWPQTITMMYLHHMLHCAQSLSHVQLCGPMDCTHQSPLSMEFSRKQYWSGLPFPTPGDIPNPEIEPTSLESSTLAGRFFITTATWEALFAPWKSANAINQAFAYFDCVFLFLCFQNMITEHLPAYH